MNINIQRKKKKNQHKSLYDLPKKRFNKRFQELIAIRKKTEPTKAELQIMQFLSSNKILFKREHYFQGLVNPKTLYPLFFDFFLPKYRVVIEFDGPHHYKPIYGLKELESQRFRDEVKQRYCIYNRIYILRIPYHCKDVEVEICKFFDKHF